MYLYTPFSFSITFSFSFLFCFHSRLIKFDKVLERANENNTQHAANSFISFLRSPGIGIGCNYDSPAAAAKLIYWCALIDQFHFKFCSAARSMQAASFHFSLNTRLHRLRGVQGENVGWMERIFILPQPLVLAWSRVQQRGSAGQFALCRTFWCPFYFHASLLVVVFLAWVDGH